MTTGKTALVQNLPIAKLRPIHNHPFKVLDDESMQRPLESISQFGVLVPACFRTFCNRRLFLLNSVELLFQNC